MQKARCHNKSCSNRLQAYGFRYFSPPDLGYFSPFPHGTGSLSVSQEYLALPDGAGGFRQSFTCSALLRILLSIILFCLRDYHSLWFNFPENSTHNIKSYYSPTTPTMPKHNWFGLFRIRSPLLTESLLFSLPLGTQMFQFPRFTSFRMIILQITGFPHSEIYGLKFMCNSPQLIAACHVLHRL